MTGLPPDPATTLPPAVRWQHVQAVQDVLAVLAQLPPDPRLVRAVIELDRLEIDWRPALAQRTAADAHRYRPTGRHHRLTPADIPLEERNPHP